MLEISFTISLESNKMYQHHRFFRTFDKEIFYFGSEHVILEDKTLLQVFSIILFEMNI